MTKPNSSLIAVVMDRSGSMSSIRQATIDGFNEFLKSQKEQQGECYIYYTQFDTEYEIIHSYKPLKDMPELTEETFVPRGSTALMDAIGTTIKAVGRDLADRSEDERPSTVVFVIQTDGYENASRVFGKEQVKEMIKVQGEQYKWQFLFLGASLESMAEAAMLGISMDNSMRYTGQNTHVAVAAMSSNVSHARSTGSTRSFTQQERDQSTQ